MKDLTRFRALTLRAAICSGTWAGRRPTTLAQDAPAAGDEENIDEVVVTGTRVATRTRLDTLAPVDVLPQETLTSTAAPSSPRRSPRPRHR